MSSKDTWKDTTEQVQTGFGLSVEVLYLCAAPLPLLVFSVRQHNQQHGTHLRQQACYISVHSFLHAAACTGPEKKTCAALRGKKTIIHILA